MSRSVIYRFSCAGFLVFGVTIFCGGTNANANPVSIYDYHQVGSFILPTSNSLYSTLPTGQLLVLNGSQVLLQNGIDSSSFTPQGNLPTANFNSGFPSFLDASPNGALVAAGDGSGDIAVFSPANPSAATIYSLPNGGDYNAAWYNTNLLAITDSNGVDVLNTNTHAVTTVVSDIDGYSGGIAFDSAGNLYTGDGYYLGSGPSQTGLIKAFSALNWLGVLPTPSNPSGGTALDFENQGTSVAQLLSAGSLGFDNSGNFYVGGADSFGSTGDYGYDTLVSATAIQSAVATQQPTLITASSSADIVNIPDPDGQYNPGYWNYNDATGELYLQYSDFGDNTVEIFSPVPEPGSIMLLTLCGAATILRRNRRSLSASA